VKEGRKEGKWGKVEEGRGEGEGRKDGRRRKEGTNEGKKEGKKGGRKEGWTCVVVAVVGYSFNALGFGFVLRMPPFFLGFPFFWF
jgi:hypothetical protein